MAKVSWEEKVSYQFPSNIRVLAIDTDPTVLEFIKKICNQYCYQVITCTESLRAANILRKSKVSINLVLMEVHMPKMDGYEFLHVNQEINVPVIMMSLDDNTNSVMKTIQLGACDYWIKPLHEDRLKNMWTHVVRKSTSENKMQKDIGSLEDDNQKRMISDNSEFVFSSAVESSREFDNVGESKKRGRPPSRKKSRIVWTSELHRKFVEVVNQLGLANAVPNKILRLMNTPGLTRSNVASHLQKYRNSLKAKSNREKQRQPQPQPQNEMSRTIEPTVADLHPGLTSNMVPKGQHQSASDIQLDNHFHAEQALGLAHAHPLATYPNIAILQNFPQSMGTLDDASRHGIWSPYNTVLAENQAMLQRNSVSVDTLQQQQQQMQQSLMHNQIHPINFQSSSMIISENPYLVTQNDNFGSNIDHTAI